MGIQETNGLENKKEEEVTAIKNKDGKLETDPEKIKEIFEDFYVNLFKPNKRGNSKEELIAKEREEIMFRSICEIAKNEQHSRKVIDKIDIDRNIKKIKRKNTYDLQGWNTKILHNCGEDAIQSIQIILNEIDKSNDFPHEWTELAIKSISKGGLNNNDVEKRRGLFITNIVNKVYEKVKMEQNDEKIDRGISKHQCGGKKGRSTVDHIMTLNAVIEYNKSIGSETYVLFADAYKCFDKLNLKNCIIDMYEDIGAEEAMKLYKLNENGKAIIKTPMGNIGPIDANEIVRQGTITGPKLCCKNTDKVNKIGKKCITYIGPNIKTETLIYVDDIQNASSNVKQLKIAVDNLKTMEKQKGFIFNNDVNKTGILIINKKKHKDYSDIKVNVNRGEIEQTKEYKYLGEWYNEKGDNSLSLAKRKEKISYYIKEIRKYGNQYQLGKYAIAARLKIYKTVIIPAIYHNIETWSCISKSEMEELEKIQAKILKKITEQRITTPYYGLLSELGVWPIEQLIDLRKVMLLHNIMTSKGERLIKEIITEQIKRPWRGCWMETTSNICKKYSIDIEKITELTKDGLKHIMKEKINKSLEKLIKEMATSKTKLRFVTNFNQKSYINDLQYQDTITMIKIRMNMIETKCNYKGKFKNKLICDMCEEESDTTEHILQCKVTQPTPSIKVEEIMTYNPNIVTEINRIMKIREERGHKITLGGESDESCEEDNE